MRDGAASLLTLGAPVVLVLLGASIVQRQPALYTAAMAAAAAFAAAGVCAAGVLELTTGFRSRSRLGAAMGWTLAAYAAAAVLGAGMAGARVLVPLSVFAEQASRIAFSAHGLGTVAFAGALFGVAMADAAGVRGRDGLPSSAFYSGGGIPLRLGVAIVAVCFCLFVAADDLARSTDVAPATTKAEGVRVAPELKRDLARRPGDAQTEYLLGQAYVAQDSFAQAEAAFRAADAAAPNDASTLNALGWAVASQHRLLDALPDFKRAVRLDSTYTIAWHNLAWAYVNLDSLDAARPAYAHAVRLAPRDARLAFDYAELLTRLGDTRLALGQMERALPFDSTAAAMQELTGFLLRTQGQFAESKSHLQMAAKLAPNDAWAWGELAVTEYLMGDSTDAARAFAKSMALDPRYVNGRPGYLEMMQAVTGRSPARTGGR